MIRKPRYRTAETAAILDITRDHLRYFESRIGGGSMSGWRHRSLLDLYRLFLALELSRYGVEADYAVTIAHETPIGHGDDFKLPGEAAGISLEQELIEELFGQVLIVQRDTNDWRSYLYWMDGEHGPLQSHLSGTAIVVPLSLLGKRLVQRIREYALGEQS
jgi:hypothetical protein